MNQSPIPFYLPHLTIKVLFNIYHDYSSTNKSRRRSRAFIELNTINPAIFLRDYRGAIKALFLFITFDLPQS